MPKAKEQIAAKKEKYLELRKKTVEKKARLMPNSPHAPFLRRNSGRYPDRAAHF